MPGSGPSILTRQQILEAIDQIDAGRRHSFGIPTKFMLIHEGRQYAPKAVVGVAWSIAENREVGPNDFSGGEGTGHANPILRNLGFKVVEIKPTFLFSWNPEKWDWEKFSALRQRWLADPTAKEDWSSGNNKSIPSGARFFLVKQGELPRGIIGSGRTTSATQQGPHWDDSGRQRNFNDLSFDVLLDSRSNGLLSVDHLQDLSTTLWSNASSGIGIPLEIAQELELRWDSFLQGIGQVTDLSLEMPDISSLPGTEEGKQVLVRHLIRERDPRIVRQKKASVIHATGGLACEICGFDFYAVYGDLGREFCECHHRLALNNGERTTRLEDLAILCANCHRMIHRRVPMLNTDKLREIVERQTDG